MTDMSLSGRFAQTDFRVGRVISRSMSVLLKNWLAFPIITAIAYLPTLLLTPPPGTNPLAPGGQPLGRLAASGSVSVFIVLAALMIFVLLIFITQAVIVHAAFQSMRNRRVDWGDSVKIAFRRFFPILGIIIIWMLVVFGLSILIFGVGGGLAYALSAPILTTVLAGVAFFVVMVVLFTMWFVALQSCVVERTGVFGSLRRSAQLTKGNRWRIFGLFLTVMILGLVVGVVLGALAGVASLFTGVIIATIVTFVWQAFWGAYYAVTGVVAYHDLRVAKEGIDIEQIAAVFD